MGAHSQLILLWAANLASQPNTARHLLEAKRRGAHIVTIDVRHTEAAAKSDEVFLVRPGTDAALALALMHVICEEKLHDVAFVERHTVGFGALAQQVKATSPAWAESITGIAAARIVELARRYAATRPAMIVLGGSSMHKGGNGWQASRAIACLPALTGNLGVAGGGFGPRHGSAAHGRGLGSITAAELRRPGTAWPNQMSDVLAALREGRVHTLLQMGSNMLSSFPDAAAVAQGLARTGLTVSHDLFLNQTAQQFADVVLPGTAWLEELGAKATHTHLYLMERALAPAGETRSLYRVLGELAQRLGVADFDPWADEEAMINAVLDHPSTGRATVTSLREAGGFVAMNVSHVAYPTAKFDTPSGKVEFESGLAPGLGLPALPGFESRIPNGAGSRPDADVLHPLVLTQGRTLGHFHAFYNNGQALPTLARREAEPAVWVSPDDAAARGIREGAPVRIFNQRGELSARAHVTQRIPAGTLWLRDGWPGLNSLTAAAPVLPDAAVDSFGFSAGQATFDARVTFDQILDICGTEGLDLAALLQGRIERTDTFGTPVSPKRIRRVVRPADHTAIKVALKAAVETGDSVTLVAERLRVDIATLAKHADLYNEVRKATRDRKAALDTARQDAAIAKAEAVAIKLLRDGRRLTPRNAKSEGAYFYPSAVEWTVLALIRIGLGDRSVQYPTSAVRMSEAFLSKIEAAARRVRAAFGETQAKLLLDYR